MVVKYNTLQNMDVPIFTLCNPGSVYQNNTLTKVVGILTDHEAEEIVFNFNSTSELNLRVNLVKREDETDNAHTYALYKAIQNRRLIFVDDIGYFIISNVNDCFDGVVHYKDITAQSVDTELSQRMIPYIEDGTYRFLTDDTGTNKGILETIVETLPLWTIGDVDDSVANKWRTFEDVDISLNCLGFLLENIQDAYECIVIFDCVNRTINVYSQDNYVKQTSIHITKNDLINSLNITEDANNLYTALSVLGGETVTISAINPLGTNVIYNFDHYIGWMSEGLGLKVLAWQEEMSTQSEPYYELNLEYYQKLSEANNLQMEIDKIDSQIKMYSRCRDNIVAESDTTFVDGYNEAIASTGGTPITIYEEISDTLAEIDSLVDTCNSEREVTLNELEIVNLRLSELKDSILEIQLPLQINTYFTAEESEELCHYIFEGSYNDEYITVTDIMTYEEKFDQMKVLYDRAKARLDRVSQPTQEFSVDVENFIFSKEFAPWSDQLETGCLINVELEVNDVAQLFLSNMVINYDDRSLKMTFGNRFNKFDTQSLFDDMLGDISKSANTINYIKEILYPIKSGEFNAMKEALDTSRNLTMNAALSSTGEEVVIDGSGYTGRQRLDSGDFDPRQIKIAGKNIVFTDDAWDTSKLALGELIFPDGSSAYGINTETMIGDIIIGNNLRILDNEGNDLFTVVDNKIASSVGDVDDRLTTLEQDNDSINIRVTEIENEDRDVTEVTTTTGYTFNSEGLRIHKSGEEISNLLDNTGMYVQRGEEDILIANDQGVSSINLTSRQYLIVGENSRFENYSTEADPHRTACFYIGE